MENFKLLHRQIDAAEAQEKLRLKKMEKLCYAQRLIAGEVGDPDVEAQYLFSGIGGAAVVAPPPPPRPGPGGESPEFDDAAF